MSSSLPPRSPSRNAVTVFFDAASSTSSGIMPEPIVAMAFLMSYFSRLRTSLRPSTMIIASDLVTFGPAVIPL